MRRAERMKTVVISESLEKEQEELEMKLFQDFKEFVLFKLEISEDLAEKIVKQIFSLLSAVQSESKRKDIEDLERQKPFHDEIILDNKELSELPNEFGNEFGINLGNTKSNDKAEIQPLNINFFAYKNQVKRISENFENCLKNNIEIDCTIEKAEWIQERSFDFQKLKEIFEIK